MVSVGIESADPAMLERHKAGVTLDEVRDTVARIKACGLRAKGLFMMGLPGETEASIQATSDFVMSLGLDDMNMSKFTPFPGAPVWQELRDEGTFEENWKLMNCLNFVFVPKAIESKEKLDLPVQQPCQALLLPTPPGAAHSPGASGSTGGACSISCGICRLFLRPNSILSRIKPRIPSGKRIDLLNL